MAEKKYSVRLDSKDNIEQLLQETYNQACQLYNHIQNEINKITNTTVLNNLDIDGKEKYGKIMNNYVTTQQKCIAQKFDIAKLMAEVVKHNGDVKGAIDSMKGSQPSTLDLNKLREIAKNVNSNDAEVYKLKK